MVAVEYLARAHEVEVVGRVPAPRQVRQHVEVVAGHPVFRRSGFEKREFLHLLVDTLLCRGRDFTIDESRRELFEFDGFVVFRNPQFFLDFLQLLLQKEFALMLTRAFFDLLADFRLQPGHLEFVLHEQHDVFHTTQQRYGIEYFLQVLGRSARQRRREIRQRRRIVGIEAIEVGAHVFLVQRVERQQFLDLVDDRERVGTNLLRDRLFGGRIVNLRDERRLVARDVLDFKPPQAFGNKLDLAFAADRVMHAHDRSHRREVIPRRHAIRRIVREHETHEMVRGVADLLYGSRPALLIDDDRHRLRREERARLQRQEQKLLR